MIYPDKEKGGRGKKTVLNTEFSNGYLAHAREIFKYCREDKVDLVMSGDESLVHARGSTDNLEPIVSIIPRHPHARVTQVLSPALDLSPRHPRARGKHFPKYC